MSILTPTKTQAKKLYDILEREDGTLEGVALDVLDAAYDLYEARGKYVCLIQPIGAHSGVYGRTEASQGAVCLGVYATQKAALSAAQSAGAEQAHVGEKYITWVLPITFQAPMHYRAERKELVAPKDEKEVDMSWLPELAGRRCGAMFVLPGRRGIGRCEKPVPCRGNHSMSFPPGADHTPEWKWLTQPDIDLTDIEEGSE